MAADRCSEACRRGAKHSVALAITGRDVHGFRHVHTSLSFSLRRFMERPTKFHSPATFCRPRIEKVVKPNTDFARVLADAGYKSEEDFVALEEMGVDAHVALGRGSRTFSIIRGW